MIDRQTLNLFGNMPREVGNPQRWKIDNINQLSRFIQDNNGLNDCFISIYPSNVLIDKIFFDNDYGPFVLKDSQKLVEWMNERDYEVIPLISGKKGFHIYMKTRPKIYGPKAKLTLTKSTYSIIESVFGNFKIEAIYIGNKQQRILRTQKRIISPDPRVIGDISRLGRIPNTLRPPENINYCTYVSVEDFLSMDESDVAKYMKKPHKYIPQNKEFVYPILDDFEYEFPEVEHRDWTPFMSGSDIPSNPCILLEGLLRPCLYHNITKIHPSHDVRAAATIDLLQAGYTPTAILHIYSTLGWEDFDEEYCLGQILSFTGYNGYYSCRKLKNLGIPTVCCVK